MTSKAGGAPRMVSLADLVSRAVRHEDLPAPVDRDLRIGSLLAMAVIAAYLLVLLLIHSTVDNHFADLPILGWGVIRRASFLTGQAVFPAVLGLLVLIGGGWLSLETGGLREANRQQNIAALVLLGFGTLYLIPLGLILIVVALNVALIALGISLAFMAAAWMLENY